MALLSSGMVCLGASAALALPARRSRAPARCAAAKRLAVQAGAAEANGGQQPAQANVAKRNDTRVLRSQLAALSQDLMAYEPQSLPADRRVAGVALAARRGAPRLVPGIGFLPVPDALRAPQPERADSGGLSGSVQHSHRPGNPAGRQQPPSGRMVGLQRLDVAMDGRRRVDGHHEPASRCVHAAPPRCACGRRARHRPPAVRAPRRGSPCGPQVASPSTVHRPRVSPRRRAAERSRPCAYAGGIFFYKFCACPRNGHRSLRAC